MKPAPDVLLLIATGCAHCPSVKQSLNELRKDGRIARLEIVNIVEKPETAQVLGVRSVPWVKIGPFELSGLKSKTELLSWIERQGDDDAMSDYFAELMLSAKINKVSELIKQQPALFKALLKLVIAPNESMSVRIGAGAVIEDFAASDILKQHISTLIEYCHHEDASIRNDACYYLGLSADAAVTPTIEALLNDKNTEVRETAAETLAELKALK